MRCGDYNDLVWFVESTEKDWLTKYLLFTIYFKLTFFLKKKAFFKIKFIFINNILINKILYDYVFMKLYWTL